MLPFKFVAQSPSYDTSTVFYTKIDPRISLSEELINSFYYCLWFPGYFGFNWDALYDCLGDFHWMKQHKIVIVHDGLPSLPQKELKVYLEILRDSIFFWEKNPHHELEVVFQESDRDTIEGLLGIEG